MDPAASGYSNAGRVFIPLVARHCVSCGQGDWRGFIDEDKSEPAQVSGLPLRGGAPALPGWLAIAETTTSDRAAGATTTTNQGSNQYLPDWAAAHAGARGMTAVLFLSALFAADKRSCSRSAALAFITGLGVGIAGKPASRARQVWALWRFERSGLAEWVALGRRWGARAGLCLLRWVRNSGPPPGQKLRLEAAMPTPGWAFRNEAGFGMRFWRGCGGTRAQVRPWQ